MGRRFGRHVRQQFVGYVALFIALGGVSYAAVALPINSVGSKQIKRGAVKSSDLGKSAVTTGKVKNGSLLSADFKPGQLPAGATGPQGATGDTGLTGPKGDKGDVGPTTGFPGSNTEFAPSTTPDITMTTRTFTLPSAGSLYLHSTGNAYIGCSGTQVVMGLYVDGQPVTGGTVSFPELVWTSVNLTAVTGTLSAGSHTVTTRVDCISGGVTPDSGFHQGNITAILLGG